MKIAIIGYGKLGRMIESTALDRGHEVGSKIDLDDDHLMVPDNLLKHDIAIEFTSPGAAFDNISRCLDAGLPVVSGTTGWTDRLDELKNRCMVEGLSFFYASNFSLGVNILFHLNRQLARIMERYEQYDVDLTEVHHTQKMDAPSGTALHLAGDILKKIKRKQSWSMSGKGPEDELHIESIREGSIPGIHEVHYESEHDEIILRHSAKDRRGFALGAVMAAEFLKDKKGFFSMEDLLNLESGQ
jgi:4-hydroxy-tetrahydrodipicolinate reductase